MTVTAGRRYHNAVYRLRSSVQLEEHQIIDALMYLHQFEGDLFNMSQAIYWSSGYQRRADEYAKKAQAVRTLGRAIISARTQGDAHVALAQARVTINQGIEAYRLSLAAEKLGIPTEES